MAEEPMVTPDDCCGNGTVKPFNDLESPTTPDSCCNDSGLDKSDIKTDSLGSASSLSSHGDIEQAPVNGHKDSHDHTHDKLPQTSSPVGVTPRKGNVSVDVNHRHGSMSSFMSETINGSMLSIDSRNVLNPEEVQVPIMGYEIMEERAKFTVCKLSSYFRSLILIFAFVLISLSPIHSDSECLESTSGDVNVSNNQYTVQRTEGDNWFVFRRYTDFVGLNERVRKIFPGLSLSLPPKRWFKNNYDKNFLEDRLLGLQAFVDNCTSHRGICNSKPVREFFCFDDPPGPHDSIEESRAHCENLEDFVSTFRSVLDAKDREIDLLKEQLDMYKGQVEELSKTLSTQTLNERKINRQKLKEYCPS